MTTRVLIADPHPLMRVGIRNTLSKYQDLEVVGEATNGDKALEISLALHPDILFLDSDIPGLKAIQVISKLKRTCQGSVRVIVLLTCDDWPMVAEMLKAGIKGCIMKDEEPDALMDAIQVVMRDKSWLSPIISEMLVGSLVEGQSNVTVPLLSDREVEILQMLSQGNQSRKISKELFISTSTVNYYLERIYRKLHVTNRVEAVATAIKQGLVKL